MGQSGKICRFRQSHKKGRECKGGKKKKSMHRYQLVWDQGKVTALEHVASEGGHKWCRLQMEVTEHFVGAPSAEKADDVGVDVGAEESVSASGSEAAGSNISGKKSQ